MGSFGEFSLPKKIVICYLLLAGCTKTDPILEGRRVPVFEDNRVEISDEKITSLGEALPEVSCDFTIDGNNQIWRGGRRIFAGLPTMAKIDVPRKVVCNGKYVYAGLSTGELVKVNKDSRNLEWTADIFMPHIPTGGSPFLDITAAPVWSDGFIYAGGLGGAFCKIRDKDGAKMWCLPISVEDIVKSTRTFNVVRTTDGEALAVSTDGKAYGNCEICKRK